MGLNITFCTILIDNANLILISFFPDRFPRNEESRKKWLDFCGINEVVLSTATKLCSNHFEEDEFIHKSKITFLKSNALPTITSKKRKKHQRLDCSLKKSKHSKNIGEEIVNNGTVDDKTHHNDGTAYNMTVNDGIVTNDGIIINGIAHMTADNGIVDETKTLSSDTCPTVDRPFTPPNSEESNCFQTPVKNLHDPRFVGAITTPHLATPRKARRALELAKRTIAKQRRKIKTLQQVKTRLVGRITTMKGLIKHLKQKDLLSETTAENLMVTRSNDNN
ncbi:hypothetical protein ACS0PU_001130 [Formica fusca]